MAKAAVAEKPKAGGGPKAGGPPDESPAMDKASLRQALKFARQSPVRVAFALDAEGKAVLSADRRKPARALMTELQDGVPGCRNPRFGTVAADPENQKLLRFSMNKAAAGGMARKLVVALKGTGFSKVELGSEDGGPPDAYEEPDEEEAGTGRAADQAGMVPTPGGPDAGQLVAKLTPLVRQMLDVVGKDPAQKAPLQTLATDAQASLRGAMLTLKREDLDKAAGDIDRFGKAVGEAAEASPAPAPADGQDGTAPQDQAARKQPNAAQVTAALTKMAQKAVPAMRADPSGAAPIKERLMAAHASLKAGDLARTLLHMKRLSGLLGPEASGALGKVFSGSGDQAGPNDGNGHAGNGPAGQEQQQARKQFDAAIGQREGAPEGLEAARKLFPKLAADWHQAEEHVRAGMGKVKAALDDLYDGDPAAAQMEKDFEIHVDAIFSKFDGTLAKDVQAASAAGTQAELDAVKADLKRTAADFMEFLKHDSVALMDENPLVDTRIVSTCEAALKSMLASLG